MLRYIRPEVRFPLDHVFCVVIVKKRKLLCLAQVVFSYFVLHSNKISLLLNDGSYTFAQPAVQRARWS